MMKKKFLVITLISALILSCSAFIIGMMPEKAMAAEGDPPAAPEITMVGASIRTADPCGLRFEAEIGSEYDAEGVEFGMYLCPTDLLTNGEFPTDADHNVTNLVEGDTPDTSHFIKKVDIPRNTLVDSDNEGKKLIRLALVGIHEWNVDRKFSAMAYIIKDSTETQATPITRSVSYVARLAQADNDPTIPSEGKTFIDGIVTNSNDFFINTSGVSIDKDIKHKGDFSHKITLGADGTKDIEISLDERFEKDVICRIKLYAKAGAANITINGQSVDTNNFAEITLDKICVTDNKVSLHIAGGVEGNELWIDDIEAVSMELSGEGVTEIPVLGNLSMIPVCAAYAEINEDGPYMRYRSKTNDKTAYDLRFKIDSIPEAVTPDDYIVFALNYSDTTNMNNGEGLWFMNFNGKNYHWNSYDADCQLCTDGTDTVAVGKNTDPDKWYYYMCDLPNHTAAAERDYAVFYSPFDILIGHIYTVTPEARERLFGIAVPAVEISMKESLSLEEKESKTLGASVVNTGYPLTYQSSNESIATVDENGMVTGVAAGECDITAKIERPGKTTVQKVCHVTVTVLVPPLELSGEGITEIAVSNVTYEPATMSDAIDLQINEKNGYLTYKSKPGKGNAATTTIGGFKILNDNGDIKDENYIVFVLRYSEDTQTINGSYTGVWFGDWQKSKGTKGAYNYTYTCLDSEFKDCSGDGDISGTFGDKTSAGTWYYAVSPTAGHHLNDTSYYGVYYENFNLTIAHIYAVSKEVRDALVGEYYNKETLIAEKRMTLNPDSERTINAAVKKFGAAVPSYELTYESNNPEVATVTSAGLVKGIGIGRCTITVTAGELGSVSCAVDVCAPPCDISGIAGVTVINVPEGTRLLMLDGLDGNYGNIEKDAGGRYWYYWAEATSSDGTTRVSLANVNVPDGEYLVLQCKFAEGTVQNGGLWPETILASTNGERYHAVFDEDGYDYTTYKADNTDEPYGTETLDADKWYFFVDGLRGDLAKFGNYYAPFDFTIANVYSVTQDARDRLFNVNIRKNDTLPAPELNVESKLAVDINIPNKHNFARLLYAGKEASALTYVSSNENIAIVDKYGFIDAKAVGTCTITVSAQVNGETLTGTCEVAVGPRDISGTEGVRVLSGTENTPLLAMDETRGGEATVTKDGATGYWLYKYTGSSTGIAWTFKNTQMKVTADVGADEFIVYQVMYTRTNVNDKGWSYPTTYDGTNEAYLKGYDREGNSLGANVTPPGPGIWHFLVLPAPGNKTACLSYYPEFEYYISDVYAVTQAGLDALFHD